MTACLPFPGAALCGYCDRQLTMQPAGDWACNPCRDLMAKTITSRRYTVAVEQYRTFIRLAKEATA